MAVVLDIRNLKNKTDLANKEKSFFDQLKLQQRLNQQYEEEVLNYAQNKKLNITEVPPQKKSFQEEQKDKILQKQIALTNLKSIMDANEAEKWLSSMSTDAPDGGTILFLNNNFKDISSELKGRKVDANFFDRFLTKYLERFVRSGRTGIVDPILKTDLDELRDDIKRDNFDISDKQYDQLERLIQTRTATTRATIKSYIDDLRGVNPATGSPWKLPELVNYLEDKLGEPLSEVITRLEEGLKPTVGGPVSGELTPIGPAPEIPDDDYLDSPNTSQKDLKSFLKLYLQLSDPALSTINPNSDAGDALINGKNGKYKEQLPNWNKATIIAFLKRLRDQRGEGGEAVPARGTRWGPEIELPQGQSVASSRGGPNLGLPNTESALLKALREGTLDEQQMAFLRANRPELIEAMEDTYIQNRLSTLRKELDQVDDLISKKEKELRDLGESEKPYIERYQRLTEIIPDIQARIGQIQDEIRKKEDEKKEAERLKDREHAGVDPALPKAQRDKIKKTSKRKLKNTEQEIDKQIDGFVQEFQKLVNQLGDAESERDQIYNVDRIGFETQRQDLERELDQLKRRREPLDQESAYRRDELRRRTGRGMMRYGHGMIHKMSHRRRVCGRGIEPAGTEKYRQFGKYVIHIPSLKKGILNIKFKSHANVPQIPQCYISQDMMEFILILLDTKQFNQREFQRLKNEEKELLKKIFHLADLDDVLGIKPSVNDNLRKDMKRFEILRGEIIAGNNAPQLLEEISQYIHKFMNGGIMNKVEGMGILQEIQKVH